MECFTVADDSLINISPHLAELPFDEDISRLTNSFIGRKWVFEEIDRWIVSSNKTFFLLTGDAGIGKSAIVAHLTQIRDDIAAYNFSIAGNNSTIVPGTVLRSISVQLGKKLPEYGLALGRTIKATYRSINVSIDVETMSGGQIIGVVINNLTLANPKQEIESLLTAPLLAMSPPSRPILLLFDSLDEAFTYGPSENLATLLAGLNNLPTWVRILMTSRPDRRISSYFSSIPVYAVSSDSAANLDDLRTYVERRIEMPALKARLQTPSHSVLPAQFIQLITGMGKDAGFADGNFLYTKILLDDIENGLQPVDNLTQLPKSLDEIYNRMLLRLAPDWEVKYQPLLAILSVAREPLTIAQLLGFSDEHVKHLGRRMSATLVNHAVGVLRQFLNTRGDPGFEKFALFHKSFRDYLSQPARSAQFACPPVDGHQAIVGYYLSHIAPSWRDCDSYGLMYLPQHLSLAGLAEKARDLLFDFQWLQSKLNHLGIIAVLADFALVPVGDNDASQQVRRALEQAAHVLADDKQQLGGQLTGRLMGSQSAEIHQLLDRIKSAGHQAWLQLVTPTLSTPSTSLLAIRRGNTERTQSAVVTPDGTRAVSVNSIGNSLTIWDLKADRPPRVMKGHSDNIVRLAITPDSRHAVTASRDLTLKIWDLETGDLIHTLQGHASPVSDMELVNNGKTVISSGEDHTIRVWDLATGTQQIVLQSGEDWITNMVVTPDGTHALTSTQDYLFKYWNITENVDPVKFGLKSDKEFVFVDELLAARPRILNIALTPDGKMAIQSDEEGMRAWDVRTMRLLWEHPYPAAAVPLLKVSSEGDKFASLAYGNWLSLQLVLWDMNTGKKLNVIRDISGYGLRNLALTPDLRTAIAIRSTDEAILAWEVDRDGEGKVVGWHPDFVRAAAITIDGHTAVTFCNDGTLRMWDLHSTAPHVPLPGHENQPVSSVAVSPDGERAVTGADDGSIKVWDLKTGNAVFMLPGDGRPIKSLAILPSKRKFIVRVDSSGPQVWDLDGRAAQSLARGSAISPDTLIVTADERYAIFLLSSGLEVWDLDAKKQIQRFHDPGHSITKFALMHDQQHLVLAFDNRTLGIYDLQTGQVLQSWAECPEMMYLTTSDDGRWIAAIGFEKSLWVWDTKDRSSVRIFDREAYDTSPIAITPDSRRIVSVSQGDIIRLWDIESGAEIYNRKEHTNEICSIIITAGGSRMVTAAWDHTVKVWDLNMGEVLAVFTAESAISCCSATPDGRHIAAGDNGGQVHILKMQS
jgi:WD40 repeat protein